MKIIFFVLLLITQSLFAQSERTFKIIGSADIYYPLRNGEVLFSNGYSVSLTKEVGKMRVSVGLSYSRLSYNGYIAESSFPLHLIREHHELEFLDFPILFSFPHVKQKDFTFHALVGVVFNKQLNYVQTRYYDNSESEVLNDLQNTNSFGLSLRTGLKSNYNLNQNLTIGLNPFLDTMFIPIFNSSRTNEIERGIVIGVNLFIGYSIF